MSLYECTVCGYIYNEEKMKQSWDGLAEDWICPVCESGKMYFEMKESSDKTDDIDKGKKAAKQTANDTIEFKKTESKDKSGIGYPAEFVRRDDKDEPYMDIIHTMAVTGKSVIEPMHTHLPVVAWTDILFQGAQLKPFVLEEHAPVTTRTVIGKRADKPMVIESPVYISHMSFGALSREAKMSLAKGSAMSKTAICSGEGGILKEEYDAAYKYIFEYVPNLYSVTTDNLKNVDAIEIKIGQGTKPGMGGHLPGKKVTEEIAAVRGKPVGQDIISPSRFANIDDIDDLKDLVTTLRELSEGRPIGIKVAAGRIESDLEVIAYCGADFVTIDGRGGGTGASPKLIKDATTVPTIYALHRARKYLDDNQIEMELIVTGGMRIAPDFAKALAMGADAIAIGSAAMMAVVCQQYRVCHEGKCPVGCATQDPELRQRLKVDNGARRLYNYLEASLEELRIFARISGKDDVHQLSIEDICTTNSEIAAHTSIPHV